MQSPPGPETVIDGKTYLYFGGTSYLGLAAREEVIEAGCAAARLFGVHSATSRARVGTNPPVAEVEERAARFFGKEAAFYFGSGYASNHILVSALADRTDVILVDEAAHYCVLEATKLAGVPVRTFHHRDAEDLRQCIGDATRPLVMVDGANPSTGALAPIESYLDVLEPYTDPALCIDDAHLFGVLGPKGRGLFDALGHWETVNSDAPHRGVRLYAGGTLSKAMGGFGGILTGTATFIERARNASHYFDGASAPPSAVAGSTARALQVLEEEPELRPRLHANTHNVRQGLDRLGLTLPTGSSAHFGVSTGDPAQMQRMHQRLLDRGIFLPYVGAYAGIPPEGLLRFAIFADHTSAQLERLLVEFESAL